jgi:hypothetical protein
MHRSDGVVKTSGLGKFSDPSHSAASGRVESFQGRQARVFQAAVSEDCNRPRMGRLVGFPAAFPWFNAQRYREERIRELREQVAAMDQPPHAA